MKTAGLPPGIPNWGEGRDLKWLEHNIQTAPKGAFLLNWLLLGVEDTAGENNKGQKNKETNRFIRCHSIVMCPVPSTLYTKKGSFFLTDPSHVHLDCLMSISFFFSYWQNIVESEKG